MSAHFTQIYDKIWELLEAHPAFADAPSVDWTGPRVKPGDRVRFNARKRNPLAKPTSRQPADFPEAILSFGAGSSSVITGKTAGYSDHAQGANPVNQSWLAMRQRMFKLILTHDGLKYDDVETLAEAVEAALMRGGARFGFEWVWQWGPISDDVELIGDTRLRQTIFIPVTIRIQGNTFIG